MPRPCTCDRVSGPTWTPDQCRLCWLFHNRDDYRRKWTQGLEPPSPLEVVLNFASAWLKHAAGGFRTSSEETVKRRLAVCEHCPARRLSADRVCLACGCLVDEKATWTGEECPLGFWGPEGQGKGCGGCAGRRSAAQAVPAVTGDEVRVGE